MCRYRHRHRNSNRDRRWDTHSVRLRYRDGDTLSDSNGYRLRNGYGNRSVNGYGDRSRDYVGYRLGYRHGDRPWTVDGYANVHRYRYGSGYADGYRVGYRDGYPVVVLGVAVSYRDVAVPISGWRSLLRFLTRLCCDEAYYEEGL